MNRSAERVRLLLGAAALCGLLVVPVALAGSASSSGDPKAAASAGVKKKLKSLQRQIDALKGTSDTPGPQGPQGTQGTRGGQGIPGPGARSFDRQFAVDGAFHTVTTVNGIVLRVSCNPPSHPAGASAYIRISSVHGWGTIAQNGVLSAASVAAGNIDAVGINTADLDVVAISTAPVEPGKYVRIDANAIRGNACNFHGTVTPSSSVG
jgi:hypothetical protein